MMDISERIKSIRGTLKQEDLALRIGVKKNTIGRWERGDQKPDSDDLNLILSTFPDINPTWLLTGEGEMRRGEGVNVAAPAAAPELDLALLEDIIIELVKAQKGPGDEVHELMTDFLARQTASTILNIYKTRKGMPSMPINKILSNFNMNIADITASINAIADKKGV